ncbi:MAG: hypothetical protein R3D81_04120 [Thalassovita sp.]
MRIVVAAIAGRMLMLADLSVQGVWPDRMGAGGAVGRQDWGADRLRQR